MLPLKPALSTLLAALAMAGLVTWLAAWSPFSPVQREEPCFLQLTTSTPTTGLIGVRIDEGHGCSNDRPADFRAMVGETKISAPLPPGRIREIRVDLEG